MRLQLQILCDTVPNFVLNCFMFYDWELAFLVAVVSFTCVVAFGLLLLLLLSEVLAVEGVLRVDNSLFKYSCQPHSRGRKFSPDSQNIKHHWQPFPNPVLVVGNECSPVEHFHYSLCSKAVPSFYTPQQWCWVVGQRRIPFSQLPKPKVK